MAELEIDRLIGHLAELLDEEYACLLRWQPLQLQEIVERRRHCQEQIQKTISSERRGVEQSLREKLEQLRRLGLRNLALARSALQVIEGINQLLGRPSGGAYRPQGTITAQLPPVLERVV